MIDFHHDFLFQISENAKIDVYAFLFDDMLLLTRFRKLPQKVNKVRRIIRDFSFFSALKLVDAVIQMTQEKEKLTEERISSALIEPAQKPQFLVEHDLPRSSNVNVHIRVFDY